MTKISRNLKPGRDPTQTHATKLWLSTASLQMKEQRLQPSLPALGYCRDEDITVARSGLKAFEQFTVAHGGGGVASCHGEINGLGSTAFVSRLQGCSYFKNHPS